MAARARNRFGPVWALDPFGVTGNESAAYNPLDLLDPGSERFAEDAAALADALVSDPPGEVREAHWNEEAVALLSRLILLCASSEPPARRTLARVRTYLTQPPEAFRELLEAMQASDAADGLVARAGNRRWTGKPIVAKPGISASTVSHHLRLLKKRAILSGL